MEPLYHSEINFIPVLIGGSPRSGTTLLNSLICSSKEVNEHMQECSYFAWNIQPLRLALSTFKKSQGHYFSSEEQLRSFHGELLRQILIATWKQEGCPRNLCLKNPNMVKDFALLSPLMPMAKFVVIVRDPLDIIASRYEAEKRGNENFSLSDDFITGEVDNINEIHASVLNYFETCPPSNMLVIEYEKLAKGLCLESLRQFLNLADIGEDGAWSRAKENMHSKNSQWITSLYGKPIQDSSIGRYASILPEEIVRQITARTGADYSKVKKLAKD